MPFYDLICQHCEGIFEKMLPVSELRGSTTCKYCGETTAVAPAVSASRVALRVVDTWKPRSRGEQLAGAGVAGPGMNARGGRNSVLHNCKGFNCSLCD